MTSVDNTIYDHFATHPSVEDLFDEFLNLLSVFFDKIRSRPCSKPSQRFSNRLQYQTITNEMFELMVSSVFRSVSIHNPKDDTIVQISGWSLDILQIQVAEAYRRQGFCLCLFEWLQNHSPTDFIFVSSITSVEMDAFMKKHSKRLFAKQGAGDSTEWIIMT